MTATRDLARNSLYNVLGQGLPLLVAVATIPVIVRGLGDARFGLLGILWMFITLLGDVGFGRAGTRFLARASGSDEPGVVNGVVRITLGAQLVLGIAFGLAILVLARPLSAGILQIEPALQGEARTGFLLLAVTAPVLSLSAALRGFLEAYQRFAAINVIRGTGSALNYLLPAGAVLVGWSLPAIMALLLSLRALMAVAFAWSGRDLLFRTGPASGGPAMHRPQVAEVLGFGAWATLSTAVSPVLVYLDRFLLGALVGVAAVGVYTAPYELVTRVLLVPGSVAAVLFPAVSQLQGMGRQEELRGLARKATRGILLLVGPVTLVLLLLAGPGLRIWLGPAAAPEGIAALQVLSIGVLANAMALVPFSTLQGIGRADITGKLHLVELPVHALLAWWMVARWGVVGAAGSWTVRTVLDAGLLFASATILLRRERA